MNLPLANIGPTVAVFLNGIYILGIIYLVISESRIEFIEWVVGIVGAALIAFIATLVGINYTASAFGITAEPSSTKMIRSISTISFFLGAAIAIVGWGFSKFDPSYNPVIRTTVTNAIGLSVAMFSAVLGHASAATMVKALRPMSATPHQERHDPGRP